MIQYHFCNIFIDTLTKKYFLSNKQEVIYSKAFLIEVRMNFIKQKRVQSSRRQHFSVFGCTITGQKVT